MYDTSGARPRAHDRRRRWIAHRHEARERLLAGDAVGMETVLPLECADAAGERLIPAARGRVDGRAIDRSELTSEPGDVLGSDGGTDHRQAGAWRPPEHDEAPVPVTLEVAERDLLAPSAELQHGASFVDRGHREVVHRAVGKDELENRGQVEPPDDGPRSTARDAVQSRASDRVAGAFERAALVG